MQIKRRQIPKRRSVMIKDIRRLLFMTKILNEKVDNKYTQALKAVEKCK